MKKSPLILLSLILGAGPTFGQLASDLVVPNSINSTRHQFIQNGEVTNLELCTYELCKEDDKGYLQIELASTGSAAAIIAEASEEGAKKHLVFYPAGYEGDEEKRHILRNRYFIRLDEGANLEAIKNRCGMDSIELLFEGSTIAVCEETSSGRVLSQLKNVINDPQVQEAEPIFVRARSLRLIPTDPFYASTNNAQFDGNYQWYMNNEGVNGGVADIDINVEDALAVASGQGVTVSIVDEGVAIDHIDLAANATGPHLNIFGDFPSDVPSTFDPTATHGTSVAGLIGAVFNNGEGISGVAPEATLSGIRLLPSIDTPVTTFDDFDEARALGFALDQIDVSNNSWGPPDGSLDLQGPGPLVLETFRNAALTGRVVNGQARGTVYVWAAGNGGAFFDRVDYDGYASSKYTVAVAALDDSGQRSSFSEEGSSIVVTAPSSGGSLDLLTTYYGVEFDGDGNPSRTSEYTGDFGGTSGSAPIVAGVVALMLEVNPELNWREVQDVLIRSAVMVDPRDGDWIENGAGLTFNHQYGAGLVDAAAAVALATPGSPRVPLGAATRQTLTRIFSGNPNDAPNDSGIIPDNDGSSLIVSYDMSEDIDGNPLDNVQVEHVELRARIITQSRTDLEIVLISPNGTQSVLQAVDEFNEEESINNWTFMSVRNWGEGSAGTWVIRITDQITGNPAILQNATLAINGVVSTTAPVAEIPILSSPPSITLDQGEEFTYTVESVTSADVAVAGLPEGTVFDPLTNTISGSILEAGLFSIPITLTDEFNVSANFNLRVVVRPTAIALGDAVGLSGIPAVFGGDAPWDFELTETNSEGPGEDQSAATSGPGLLDGQSSAFGFDNLGAGVLMFDWRTSSEAGADRLWFNRGGEVPQVWDAFIDGPREWATSAVILPDVSNNIRWIYSKNDSPFPTSSGEDRGLVDNLQLIEMDRFLVSLQEAGPITGFTPEFDNRTIFYPREGLSGSPAVGGSIPMVIASPAIGNGQSASLSGWLEGPGRFTATVELFAHESDVFELLIDGVVVESRDGNIITGSETNTININRAIAAGRHRVELRYRKDFSIEAFGDLDPSAAAVEPFEGITLDDVSYVADASFAAFLLALGNIPDDGDEYSTFQEYAFGGDPRVADIPRFLPAFVEASGNQYLEYGFDTSLTNLDYSAQQSTNLIDWEDVDSATLDRVDGDVEVFRVPIDGTTGAPRLFFRVSAEER